MAYIGIGVERLPDSDTTHSLSRRENIPVSEIKNIKITWITEDEDEVYIHNEGVLDITQDNPDALNELTIHFRDDVSKNITIDAKLGVGLTFDTNDAIELDDTIKIKLNCNNEPD